MKRLLVRTSLKRRIWISFLVLTLISISLIGSFSYYFSARVMERSALQMSQSTLNKTAQVLDERLRHVVVAVSTFMMSDAFQKAMGNVQVGNVKTYYNDLSALQTPFAQMKLIERTIDSAYVYSPIGEFYPTDKSRRGIMPFERTRAYKAIANAEEPWNTLWIESYEDELFNGGRRVISLVMKPMVNKYLPDVYIVVNIREDAVLSLIERNMNNDQIDQLLLRRDGGTVFLSEQADSLLSDVSTVARINGGAVGDFEYKNVNGAAYLVNYSELEMNPEWTLFGLQSKSDLLRPMRNIGWVIMAVMAGCIVLAIIFSSVLSEVLLRPLFKLRSLMMKVEQNDLDVRFESRYDDEVTHVGHKFNRMLVQIQSLISEVKLSEQEKRKAEVKALQAQIDPHFLYNTLNTIFWKCEMEEYDAVKEMIVSLSVLFRLGLNNGNEITTLRKEIEHVSQYLNLQTKCYNGLFTYTIDVLDEELSETRVLKILLQPLVENSIMHGFQNLSETGRIRILIEREEEFLKLEVTDNGSGMDTQHVLRQMASAGEASDSYALSNVRSRLLLYYGERASLKLMSEPYVQTAVTLRIPIDKET